MLSLTRSNHVTTFLASVVFLYMFSPSFGTAGRSSGQMPENPAAQERVIKRTAWRNEPVKIVKLKVKGKPVEPARKFLAENDWLRGLTVSVKNTSDKTIVWIDLALDFPRSTDSSSEPDARDHLIYGHYPPPPGGTATLHPEQPPVRPNETVDLVLTDYEGVSEF